MPATGRIYRGVPEQLRELPFIRYYITINGAEIYDAVEKRALYRAEIPAALTLRALDYMDAVPSSIYDCYQDGWGYISAAMLDVAGEYMPNPGILKLIRSLRTPVDELRQTLRERGRPVQKLQMYFTDLEERARQLRLLPELFPELSISSSVESNIEINSAEATKGRALAALCKLLGVDIRAAIAFGDGSNDTDMLSSAGLGVAMANAAATVKAAADYVTDTNNAAGVAAAIRRFVL